MRIAALVALVLVGCASSDPATRRREEFFEAHPDTSPDVRRAIEEGEVLLGMTHAEVVASLGRFDSAGPDVSDLGAYHVRLYGTKALTFHGEEIEDAELIFSARWSDDPTFGKLRRRILWHRERHDREP